MGKTPVRLYCQKRHGVLAGMGVDTPETKAGYPERGVPVPVEQEAPA